MNHPGFLPRLLLALVLAFSSRLACTAEKPKPLPPFETVQKVVEEHFRRQAGYRPGDIISRSAVASLLAQLPAIGFTVTDREAILADVPGDEEFLVATLRTPAGRKFMHRIAALPQAYDRLQRLARLPHGQQTILDLIRGPGGDELIRYFTTTRGGRWTGKLLSNSRSAEDFNKPTGRIYTVPALLDRLQKSYAEAASGRTSGR